jgi:hypothetical protein
VNFPFAGLGFAMYYFLVTLCRSIFAFGLVLLWMAMPALACLPNAAMTQVEMDCCKKMAGDCHMGASQHPCCKTTVERATPVASLDRVATRIHPYVVVTSLQGNPHPKPMLDRAGSSELIGQPPPAPPGLHPVLRI